MNTPIPKEYYDNQELRIWLKIERPNALWLIDWAEKDTFNGQLSGIDCNDIIRDMKEFPASYVHEKVEDVEWLRTILGSYIPVYVWW